MYGVVECCPPADAYRSRPTRTSDWRTRSGGDGAAGIFRGGGTRSAFEFEDDLLSQGTALLFGSGTQTFVNALGNVHGDSNGFFGRSFRAHRNLVCIKCVHFIHIKFLFQRFFAPYYPYMAAQGKKPILQQDTDTVRIGVDVPRDLHLKLVQSAQENRRSLAQQIIVLLEGCFDEKANNMSDLVERLEAFADFVSKNRSLMGLEKNSDVVPVLYMDADARIEEERKKGKR